MTLDCLDLDRSILARLARVERWFVLTGAGVSAESGVPAFRGPGGLWEGFRPEDLASPEGFRRDPARVWRWYRWRREVVAAVSPNAAHAALALMEGRTTSFCLTTQNVDGLHRRAGSRNVLEIHGNILRSRCLEDCGAVASEDQRAPVPTCTCGAPLRPDVVWFGEALPEQLIRSAVDEAARCQAALVVGTSGIVYPAAMLPQVAKGGGALVIEINPEETPLGPICDFTIRLPAAKALPLFIESLGMGEEPARPEEPPRNPGV